MESVRWCGSECKDLQVYKSHTLRHVGRGGGSCLLISNNWKYSTHAPLCNNISFESHAITVTAPVKLHVVVIYRPPGQSDTFPRGAGWAAILIPRGWQSIVFGDFNINLEKP